MIAPDFQLPETIGFREATCGIDGVYDVRWVSSRQAFSGRHTRLQSTGPWWNLWNISPAASTT